MPVKVVFENNPYDIETFPIFQGKIKHKFGMREIFCWTMITTEFFIDLVCGFLIHNNVEKEYGHNHFMA